MLRVGSVTKLEDEEVRLNSLGNLLDHIGWSRDIWIDFAEDAFNLLRTLANSLRNMDGQADEILLRTFNDPNESMSIITYVKVCRRPATYSYSLTTTASCQCLDPDPRR